jgi:hypothetical protein
MPAKRPVLYYFHGIHRKPASKSPVPQTVNNAQHNILTNQNFIKIVSSALIFGTGAKIKSSFVKLYPCYRTGNI